MSLYLHPIFNKHQRRRENKMSTYYEDDFYNYLSNASTEKELNELVNSIKEALASTEETIRKESNFEDESNHSH